MNKFVLFFYTLIFAVTGLFASSHVDIFQAIKQGDIKTVKRWIKSKPDLLIFNDQGQTVLHAAVMTGDWSMVKTVLSSRVDLNMLDFENKTALDQAVERGFNKAVYKLVKKGAKVTCQNNIDKVQTILQIRYKKIMRVFWIIFSTVILTAPIWVTCWALCLLPQPPALILFAQGMAFTFLTMWLIPVYASRWKEKHFSFDLKLQPFNG